MSAATPREPVHCVVCGVEQPRAPGPPDIPHAGGWTCMRHRDQQARLDREAVATPREPEKPDMRGISRCWHSESWHVYMAGPCFDTYEQAIAYRDELDREGITWKLQRR